MINKKRVSELKEALSDQSKSNWSIWLERISLGVLTLFILVFSGYFVVRFIPTSADMGKSNSTNEIDDMHTKLGISIDSSNVAFDPIEPPDIIRNQPLAKKPIQENTNKPEATNQTTAEQPTVVIKITPAKKELTAPVQPVNTTTKQPSPKITAKITPKKQQLPQTNFFFEHINSQGAKLTVNDGSSICMYYGDNWNDKITTVKVAPQSWVTVYQHTEFQGHSYTFTNNTGSYQTYFLTNYTMPDGVNWNDQVSSIKTGIIKQ